MEFKEISDKCQEVLNVIKKLNPQQSIAVLEMVKIFIEQRYK